MVDGLAVHWYEDSLAKNPPSILSDAHAKFPGKWMLYTEVVAREQENQRILGM